MPFSAKDLDVIELCDAMVDKLHHAHARFLTASNLSRAFQIPRKSVVYVLNTYADNVECFYRTPASAKKRPAFRLIRTP